MHIQSKKIKSVTILSYSRTINRRVNEKKCLLNIYLNN